MGGKGGQAGRWRESGQQGESVLLFSSLVSLQEATCSWRWRRTPKSVAQKLRERFLCVFVVYLAGWASVLALHTLGLIAR